jgi:tetratricopeptide (TPR) repeat protein
MLILDNADDPDVDYHAYLPPGSFGVVVLTSRNVECKQYATTGHVGLEGLSTDEATELLLKAADIASDQRPQLEEDARKVAVLLHSHPLALIQAGAYIARGHCSLAEYPRVYERHRKRLLGFRRSQAQSRYRDVYATFEASVQILQASRIQSSQDALELLPLLAVCGPNRLPLLLFEAAWNGAQRIPVGESSDENILKLTEWHLSRLPSLMQASGDVWDSFRLVEAVNALKAFALVSTNVDNGHITVSMHPLVHAWARDRQDERQQHESWIAMGCVMALSGLEKEIWRLHARQLQPHLQATTSWEMGCMFRSEPRAMVASTLMQCGWLLLEMRDDGTLFLLLDRLCSHLGLDKTTVDPRWVDIYLLIGGNLLDCGKIREAVQVLKEVVRIFEQTLAEDHPSRLGSQRLLAVAYSQNGQMKEAVKLLEEVVRTEQALAEDDTSRLASQHSLASVYLTNGQVKEAVELLEEVVRIRQALAEDDPSRLASQNHLARAYNQNGQMKEAVKLLEEVVPIQEHALAEDHPSRLASQHNLARVYEANGQVKEAVELMVEVVRITKQVRAEDDPDRLVSQNTLAILWWKLNQHSAAVEMMRHVVEIRRQVLDRDHPDRVDSEEWLKYFEDESSECERVA